LSHRAVLYTVAVHREREPDKPRLLGNIDGNGASLLGMLEGCLPKLDYLDGSRVLRYLRSKTDGNELMVRFRHGEDGVEANITDGKGRDKYHQQVDDWSNIECGCLWNLPPNQTTGWLALHVYDNRGTKTMLGQHLKEYFRKGFPGLALQLDPFVMESALREAADKNLLKGVKLVRRVRPSDGALAQVNPWVEDGTVGKEEVTFSASLAGKWQHLRSTLLRRALDGDVEARDAILQYKGQTYDEVKFTVAQGDTTRTYNLERPGVGHPVSMELNLASGQPEDDDLYAELRRALSTVTG